MSPVAIAARVISLEESVTSTARMRKAAEAVALEDRSRSVEEGPELGGRSPAARSDGSDEADSLREVRGLLGTSVLLSLKAFEESV